jgi:hypothetical protein
MAARDSLRALRVSQAVACMPPLRATTKAFSASTLPGCAATDYFESEADVLIKGRTYGTPRNKIIVPGVKDTGNVKQTLEARNVPIQQVITAAELKPSVVEFLTDGSPAIVVYGGGCCKSDDLRRHRIGGYAVLNAFELIQMSAASQ